MVNRLNFLWISAIDPSGIAGMYSNSINTNTPHSSKSIVLYEKFGFDEDISFNRTKWGCFNMKPPEYWSRALSVSVAEADIIVVTLGSDIRNPDKTKKIYDLTFDVGDGRTFDSILPIINKKIVAFASGSTMFLDNINLYLKLCKDNKWPIITCHPYVYDEIKKRYNNCTYIPMLINTNHPRYRNSKFHFISKEQYKSDNINIVHAPISDRDNGVSFLKSIIEEVNNERTDINFNLMVMKEQGFGDVINAKKMCQIGFDRIDPERPMHGVSSIENMALGLINIVHLREKDMNEINKIMGTTPPWILLKSPESVKKFLQELSFDTIFESMRSVYDYARESWDDKDHIHKVVDAIVG